MNSIRTPWLLEAAARAGRDGQVVLIGIAQERASVLRAWKAKGQEKAAHPHMEWGRPYASPPISSRPKLAPNSAPPSQQVELAARDRLGATRDALGEPLAIASRGAQATIDGQVDPRRMQTLVARQVHGRVGDVVGVSPRPCGRLFWYHLGSRSIRASFIAADSLPYPPQKMGVMMAPGEM